MMMMTEAEDGQSLLNHFKGKASEDPMNAPSHLSNLNQNADFHALFHKFMQGCKFEIEFEKTW
ncbi:hypothetical protein J1N35_018685 [Gossypium stocksii]|uniref:Uncharacterized protein n=1 Tax=Gossypium stocksii TaxID=47602 RepID=A0A9D3VRP4_9ROSI|nr:hypothetical protein J1N35_018685 [Gossypium stocksii]